MTNTERTASGHTLTVETLKGSPSYEVKDASGKVVGRAHCVNVPNDLFTLVVGERWSGVGPQAAVVQSLLKL